jgi:hypothetical protein
MRVSERVPKEPVTASSSVLTCNVPSSTTVIDPATVSANMKLGRGLPFERSTEYVGTEALHAGVTVNYLYSIVSGI